MSENLANFITDYIALRRQPRIEAFEKEATKRLEQGEDASVIAQERQKLEDRYHPQNWLTDAARRAGQISLVTHAAKFTHGDSKSSSVYRETQSDDGYLSTTALTNITPDAVGNAAVLDVAKLLQMNINGDSLLACLKRGDVQPLKALAEDDVQLTQWVAGFNQALVPSQPASHKLAKQIYFPVGDNYHLLCPLFATSLAQALYEKMVAARFGEEAKAARDAHRAGHWHSQADTRYPRLAEMHFGGARQQNISALNCARGGRIWLLPSLPPEWANLQRVPENMRSLFAFNRVGSGVISRMTFLLKVNADKNNIHIRKIRAKHVDEMIDLLFMQASALQQEKWQGWSQKCPELPQHQKLWLDPWLSKTDEAFKCERDKNDWQAAVADDFVHWLKYRLKKTHLDVSIAEQREWCTQSFFRQRMREMEAILQEALK